MLKVHMSVAFDSGAIKDKYNYYAFGNFKNAQTNTSQDYKYTGKPFDDDGGVNLYYYGARYYDGFGGGFYACDPKPALIFRLEFEI
jgi:RHS repeat-associated protein